MSAASDHGWHPHEAGPNRPDCRTPNACISKGPGHCRGCTGAVMMARLLADPERVAARLEKSIAGRDTESYRVSHRRKIAKQRRSKTFREAEVARGRETVERWRADPGCREKANETARATLAVKWAARVAVPVDLIDEFRVLRRKRLTVDEARDTLRRSYPETFGAFESERRSEALKALGPAPAIGMPERAAWTKRAAEIAAFAGRLDGAPASRARDGEERV